MQYGINNIANNTAIIYAVFFFLFFFLQNKVTRPTNIQGKVKLTPSYEELKVTLEKVVVSARGEELGTMLAINYRSSLWL